MARGKPALWSTVIGLPYLLAGLFVYVTGALEPKSAGLPFVAFGLLTVGIGIYLRSVAEIEPPELREGEELLEARHPTQRVARAKMAVSIPFLLGGGYLLLFTRLPYVYPTLAFAVGLYFFSSGAYIYWGNTVTTYYLTDQRIIKEYAFFSVLRQEIPLDLVRGVQERKSIIENLVGLGNVRVASGRGETLELVVRNIDDATTFADEIRKRIGTDAGV